MATLIDGKALAVKKQTELVEKVEKFLNTIPQFV